MEVLWVISLCVCVMATLGSQVRGGSGILLARRRGRWHSSQATVTGHGSRMVSTGPPAFYPAIVHHAVARYTDVQGKQHTLEVPEQPADNTVPILFDPRRPGHACADEEFSTAGFLAVLAIAAITGLLLYLIPAPWAAPPR